MTHPFPHLGAFLRAVAQASGGFDIDPRLTANAAAVGLHSGVPSEGGFLVPDSFAVELWQATYDTGEILRRCTRQPVTTGRALKIPAFDERSRADGSRWGGTRLYWADEADTVTATTPKYRQVTLHPNKILGLTYATDELLADSPALASVLTRAFSAEATVMVEDEIVNGSGLGRPLGFLKSNALLTVAPESGQAAATFLAANAPAMLGRLWGASRRNAVWLVNPDIEPQLIEMANAGSTAVTFDDAGYTRLIGKPVLPSEAVPALGSQGDAILADLSQYLIAETAPEFIGSIHVRFLDDEGAFRFSWRIDGQPAWAGPVTPKNGSTTQAPFVALEARAE